MTRWAWARILVHVGSDIIESKTSFTQHLQEFQRIHDDSPGTVRQMPKKHRFSHRNIQHTVKYTATNPVWCEKLWR
jgi:hypothetical protein